MATAMTGATAANAGAARRVLPIMKPWMDEREAEAARRPILAGWVTQGPEVAAFEREFAAYVGAPHACAVSNCTTALHLALRAIGVREGQEVITVSHSFIATANAVRYCGATPVFVDVEPDTFNIDPRRIDAAITTRTSAILVVHQMGMPADLPAILEIARRHGLRVVEDAACAIGSEIQWAAAGPTAADRAQEARGAGGAQDHSARTWQRIGKPHADIACFSFHPRKLVTTGDGGMLTTTNEEWDRKFRLWRQHSMSVSDAARHGSAQVVFEAYPELGFNYRMTDVQAAIGREQLRKLPEMIARRRLLAGRYHELLADVPGVTPPAEPAWARSNYQSYCVRLPAGADQKRVMQSMLDAGVSTRRGIMNSHRERAYAHEPCRWSDLRASETAQDCCILLPLFHQMTDEDQEAVVAALREALAR